VILRLEEPQILWEALCNFAYRASSLEELTSSVLLKTTPTALLLADADANKGKASIDTAATEITVLRIVLAVGNFFIIFTFIYLGGETLFMGKYAHPY